MPTAKRPNFFTHLIKIVALPVQQRLDSGKFACSAYEPPEVANPSQNPNDPMTGGPPLPPLIAIANCNPQNAILVIFLDSKNIKFVDNLSIWWFLVFQVGVIFESTPRSVGLSVLDRGRGFFVPNWTTQSPSVLFDCGGCVLEGVT